MKWLKYSQYIYLVTGILFLISAAYKYFNNEASQLQLIIASVLIIMFLVRRNFIKRMENRQKNQ